jgi:hypothetical protein
VNLAIAASCTGCVLSSVVPRVLAHAPDAALIVWDYSVNDADAHKAVYQQRRDSRCVGPSLVVRPTSPSLAVLWCRLLRRRLCGVIAILRYVACSAQRWVGATRWSGADAFCGSSRSLLAEPSHRAEVSPPTGHASSRGSSRWSGAEVAPPAVNQNRAPRTCAQVSGDGRRAARGVRGVRPPAPVPPVAARATAAAERAARRGARPSRDAVHRRARVVVVVVVVRSRAAIAVAVVVVVADQPPRPRAVGASGPALARSLQIARAPPWPPSPRCACAAGMGSDRSPLSSSNPRSPSLPPFGR